MADYYNEIDPFAAAWLRELMKAGQIPDGEVDERSIELVQPDDVRGFRQCHFFAGIGGWALALRLAGWPDGLPVWTGSCPCQPFSCAGAQAGGHDPRDLWPVWFQLIAECRPSVIFGEQVEAAIGHGWLDRLCDDLEAENYAVGAAGLSGPSVGAFDIRQRLWFVADTGQRECNQGSDRHSGAVSTERGIPTTVGQRCGAARELADTGRERRQQDASGASRNEGSHGRQPHRDHIVAGDGADGELGITPGSGRERQRDQSAHGEPMQASPWSVVDWLPCSDGKARPVEPGTFPLAHGVPARVGRLRGYGNAIKPQVAQVFIESYLDARGLK